MSVVFVLLANITYPTGVLASQTGFYNANSNLNWAFSHSPTQLCATASRTIGGTDLSNVTTYQACSESFASTMGSWVHGAFVFDAPTGLFSFFLNGKLLNTMASYPTPTVVPGASMPDSGNGADIRLLSSFDLPSGATTSVSAGTAVDNIRLLKVQDGYAADIAATYNQPWQTSSAGPNTVVYAEFHAGSHATPGYLYIFAHGSAASPGQLRSFFSLFPDPTQEHYLTATSTPRSCDHAGCGIHDTVGKDVASTTTSSSTASAGSSSSGAAASTSSSSSTGDGCGSVCAGSLAAPSFLAIVMIVVSLFRMDA